MAFKLKACEWRQDALRTVEPSRAKVSEVANIFRKHKPKRRDLRILFKYMKRWPLLIMRAREEQVKYQKESRRLARNLIKRREASRRRAFETPEQKADRLAHRRFMAGQRRRKRMVRTQQALEDAQPDGEVAASSSGSSPSSSSSAW